MFYVLLVLIAVIATLCVLAARQPDEFRVTRERLIEAPAVAIFAHVNDLEKWQAWSPWARMEPDAATQFEGPKSGMDAKMSWIGRKTGQGSMTIIDSRPPESIRFRLAFLKPMRATNAADFHFSPDAEKTRVSWTMTGTSNFVNKLVGLVLNCDKIVGAQFDQGLANLAEIVEKEALDVS